jgi:hypothetical protein
MKITEGLELKRPNVLISWSINEIEFRKKIDNYDLLSITTGYYVIFGTLFNNLNCKIGFHFLSKINNELNKIEIFDTKINNKITSFETNQKILEQQFGKPQNCCSKKTLNSNNYTWFFDSIKITHCLRYRFGYEELIWFEKL